MSGRRELTIGLVAYTAYLLVRKATWTDAGRRRADANARRLLRLEQTLGIAVERRVQNTALRRPRLVHALNLGYGAFNVGLTLGLLLRRYRARDPGYRLLRRQAILAHAGALPIFLAYPTAPPRKLDGFVDTMQEVSGIDLEHPLLVRLYNPLAAMPSQHLSLAVVTGGALTDSASTRPGRIAATAYAPVVGAVVVATGNHYVLDVAAGAALGYLARALGERSGGARLDRRLDVGDRWQPRDRGLGLDGAGRLHEGALDRWGEPGGVGGGHRLADDDRRRRELVRASSAREASNSTRATSTQAPTITPAISSASRSATTARVAAATRNRLR